MNDYTPPTEQVREIYAEIRHESTGFGFDTHRSEFNRWVARTLQEAKAEAWEEGHIAAAMRVPEGVWHDVAAPRPANPYRQEQNT